MRAPFVLAALMLALSTGLSLHSLPAQAAAHAAPAPSGPSVAWLDAANDADIDRAQAQARSEKKPLLLYWGASWCPPCNQLKATLFNRADFIERSRSVVAVNIDGDLPGAQKLASRFKVRGYPTLILMNPDGGEITRLPGEAAAPQVLRLLQLGLSGGRPVKALLADAVQHKPLKPQEWQALAWYSWDTDESQLVLAGEGASVLADLAVACPRSETEASNRLLLKALAMSNEAQGIQPDAALRQRVIKLLGDARASRAQMDVLSNFAREITLALAPEPGATRDQVLRAFEPALQRLQADASLSRADRLGAVSARVELARLDQPKTSVNPKLPPALTRQVSEHVARDDREIQNTYERQAVITNGAYTLGRAGLWAQSEAMLKASLPRSPAPYYLMSQLGDQARKRGLNDEAVSWYEQAWARSEGPATRLQWGAALIGALTELTPQNAARIEQVARQILAEGAKDPASFHERSARALQRVGARLSAWNRDGSHDAVLRRLVDGPDGLLATCSRLGNADDQRTLCDNLAISLGAGRKG